MRVNLSAEQLQSFRRELDALRSGVDPVPWSPGGFVG
jgi:hypothetical protein